MDVFHTFMRNKIKVCTLLFIYYKMHCSCSVISVYVVNVTTFTQER